MWNDAWTLVDVAVREDHGQSLAIEIELTANTHIIENIERDLMAGYDRVIIVTRKDLEDSIKALLSKHLSEGMKEKVDVRIISEFLAR